jgi:hypothetical protein
MTVQLALSGLEVVKVKPSTRGDLLQIEIGVNFRSKPGTYISGRDGPLCERDCEV